MKVTHVCPELNDWQTINFDTEDAEKCPWCGGATPEMQNAAEGGEEDGE